MWSHFILTFSVLAIFIECRPEQNNKKLKAAIKKNSDESDIYENYNTYFQESEEKKVI